MAIIMQSQPRHQQEKKESIWETLGRGFASSAGQSLGTGLGQLATQGLGMLMDPNQRPLDATTLEALGLDPSQAKSIAQIRNPAVQRDIVNKVQERQELMKQKQIEQAKVAQFKKDAAAVTGQQLPGQMAAQSQAPMQPGMEGQPQKQAQVADNTPLTEHDIPDIMNDLATEKELVRLGQKRQELEQKNKHANTTEIRASWNDHKKYMTKGRERAESSEEGEGIVNAMESLEKTGKVESGPWAELLSKHGLEAFLSAESIAFEKLKATFMGGAKNIIGGRVTNQEMQQFMKSIPSLSQSPEGRALIYENMRNKFELDKQYYQAIQDTTNEYEGRPLPHNLEHLVHERMKPHYKSFQDKFKTVDSLNKNEQDNNTFAAKPPASSMKNKTIENRDGTREWSDGVTWHKGPKPKQAANTDSFSVNQY